MPKRRRLDEILVARALAPSRDKAKILILAGKVKVRGERAPGADLLVAEDEDITVEALPRFVSRAGDKLDAAFAFFGIKAEGLVCADVGAATGGFTDVLLQHGASRVYAVDVGYGDLHWKVRSNPRVVPVERTNARYLKELPERVSLVCIDVSFISLTQIVPTIKGWLEPEAQVVCLVKPQFEVKVEEVPDGGVVVDPILHERVLMEIREHASRQGFEVLGEMPSPILGGSGNREFLLGLRTLS